MNDAPEPTRQPYQTHPPRRLMARAPWTRFVVPGIILILGIASSVAYVWQARLMLGVTGNTPPPPPLVCIDPGHPTRFNSGTRIVNGTCEMLVNWQVALRLEGILKERYGVRVIKTREERDMLVSNPDRARVANAAGAAIMVRLHCDAGPNHGFTLYHPDRQGEDVGVTGPSQEVIEESTRAAYAVHSGMASILKGILKDRGVMGESRTKVGRRQGALTGSIFSEVPTLTVEMVFLTNRSDAEFIKTEGGQERMARALANGVMAYLDAVKKREEAEKKAQ